jgi:cytidine deaminase
MAAASARDLPEDQLQDLLRVAHGAAQLAHAPYSKIGVGAALLCESGEVYSGCNVENASLGLTICAERTAVVKAVSSGHRRFRAIAIAATPDDPLMPCGACRQFLLEFESELLVISQGRRGPRVSARLSDLLPRAFTPRDWS